MNIPKHVRAATLVAPGRLELRTFPYTAPTQGAVTVKVLMAGICGTDKHTFAGYTQQYGDRPLRFPLIQGHEIVAQILEVGFSASPLTDFYGAPLHPGDRVVVAPNLRCGECYYCRHGFPYYMCSHTVDYGNLLDAVEPPYLHGGWAEAMYLLPGTFLFRVPDQVPDSLAVLTELIAVTHGLDQARSMVTATGPGFKAGDTVVVQGTGPIGACHIVKARMLGAGRIIAVDAVPYRLELAAALGADETICLAGSTEADRIARVRELTAGRGADVVVEAAGVPEAVPEGLEMLRPGGTYIEVGNFSNMGTVTLNPHRHLLARNVRLIGVGGDELTAYGPSLELLQRWSHRLPLERIITHRFELAAAPEAMAHAMQPESLKVVLLPQQ